EAGKGKGRERCRSGGLERHSAVGRRIGVAGTRRSHVSGVAVRVHDVGRAGIDIVTITRIAVTVTVTVAIARIAVAVAITEAVPQAKSAEAEETRVITAVTVPSTAIVSTTHVAAMAPAESASTHVTTTAHAT